MTIRKSVTLVAMLVTLTVAVALILVAHFSQDRLKARLAHEVTTSKTLLWNQATERLFERMESGIHDVEADFALRQAIKQRDAEELLKAVGSLVNLIGDQGYFERIYLFDASQSLLYSSGEADTAPAGPPPDVTALVGIQGGGEKPLRGIGRNASGEPVALLTFALSIRHKPIGLVVFQTGLAPALERIKKTDGSEVYLLGADGRLFAGTQPELLKQLAFTPPPLGDSSLETLTLGATSYATSVAPIQGVDGQPVAHLVNLEDNSESHAAHARFQTLTYVSVTLSLLLAGLGLFYYMKFALGPIDKAVAKVAQMAEGDLSVSFETNRRDEVGRLMRAMQTMVERIRDIVGHLHSASGDLNQSAGDMARLAETSKIQFDRQKTETSHVDLAVTQMATSAQEVATHTTRVVDATAVARARIESSRQILAQTTEIIEVLAAEIDQAAGVVLGLADRSQAVGNVLDVIRHIASQTNLLALNASIEAARAGEQGRGFSVVADEVRQLATRTHHSIQEIEGMIGALQSSSSEAIEVMHANRDRAKQSVDRYGQAVQNLDAFSESVNILTDMSHQIASAAEEQSRMAEQIALSINQISQLAQDHADAAGSGFEHSARLNDLSNALRERVSYFRIH